MYYLQTEAHFDAAHFLTGYPGKCSNLHGHRWRVVLELEAQELAKDNACAGMLVDFSAVKAALKEECEAFDHKFIFERGTLPAELVKMLKAQSFELVELPFRPTAENLARYFYERMIALKFPVSLCRVYESPENCAAYGSQKCSVGE